MITIKVVFFAAYREQLDCEQLAVECAAHTSIEQIKAQLASKGGQWQQVFSTDTMLVAVNHNLVDATHIVQAQDEVAFFPPVTGG